jgi:hypothetical protein
MTQTAVEKQNSRAKTIMIFILVMALSGLADLVAEIVPQIELGPIEIGISTFWFVPLTLCILFNNWWAALAAPIGEIVFSDLLLGEFGGLGEFEEVVLVTIALYIAGWLVKDVRVRRQLIVAGLMAYLISELPASFIDMSKVWFGVEEFEAVEGLPQSVFIIEMIDFAVEYVVTGIIFGLLPTLWLAPRLHGKLEPLMGIRPRSPQDPRPAHTVVTLAIMIAIGLVVAGVIANVSELGFNIVEWEPEFLDTIGEWFIWISIVVAAVVAAAVLVIRARKPQPA